MTQTYIIAGITFIAGFLIAWVIRTISIFKLKRVQKGTEGYLESERLMKETLQKEIAHLHQIKEATEFELTKKLKQAEELNKVMDEDILLLQKSNEYTEKLLQAGEPALHALKVKLIEANNTIARYKSQLELKD
ncbi:MAG: hypothetical protein ABIN67_17435 [Ferruginibacter sp.]